MSRVTRGQLKVDGPRLRVNTTQLAIIQEAGYAAGLVPAEFLARAAVTAAKNILRELYLEQPREFERVLRRASEQARTTDAGIDAISFAALIDSGIVRRINDEFTGKPLFVLILDGDNGVNK